MYLVWIGAIAVIVKLSGFGALATMSWWWVLLPLGLAIIWFEWLERLFGRDRRKAEAAAWADHRKERIASQFRKGQGRQ
ncbi:MAG: TIGR04438 family Trp-rich protein [Burkholderiales bacterium]|jgi:small Trp-rich protein|nr:TIGR04438 family Trp-rich protein [Burkholderiales bacterium]